MPVLADPLLDNAILAQHQIAELPKPGRTDINFLQEWNKRTSMGSVYIDSLDRDVWNDKKAELFAVNAKTFEDELSAWFAKYGAPYYQRYIGRYFNEVSDHDIDPSMR